MINLILLLPLDVVVGVMSNWCETSVVAKTDTAFCNRKARNEFLSILKDNATVLQNRAPQQTYLSWVELRGINLAYLSLNATSFVSEELQPNVKLEKVRQLTISRNSRETTLAPDPPVVVNLVSSLPLLDC